MKAFYGSRFSKNMTKTPEGFLICHNVPVARTGWYEYLGRELGLDNKNNEIIKVYRSPKEVFSKKAVASFEGKIVTDEHPPDLLTPQNAQRYTKGTMQNIRQSKEEPDLLLADLVIYDKRLIEEIQDGKREVSCGYDCVYVDNGNGTYSQTEICGNHVAVVETGRAGSRVAIKDSNKEMEGEIKSMSKVKIPKKNSTTTKILAAIGLKQFAIDADPEDIADVVDEMASENQCDEVENQKKEEVSNNKECKDEENSEIAQLKEQVSKLTELVHTLIQSREEAPAPEDAIDELINQLDASEEDSETIEMDEDIPSAEVSDPEDRPENPIPNADSIAMVKALKAIKPVIAGISDTNERKKACDSLIAEFKKVNKPSKKTNGYTNILKSQKQAANDNIAKKKNAHERAKYNENLGEEIAKKYNANLREEK